MVRKIRAIARGFFESMRYELRAWKFKICGEIPGNMGVVVRRALLCKEFEACGENVMILEGLVVDNPQGLSIGSNFACNRGCHFNAGGKISIGNDVLIGPGVKIWSVNHNFADVDTPVIQQGYTRGQVTIEDGVWIGANVCVLPGVTIGAKSVVGAATVLTKSVPPFSLVVGNPGRVLRSLKTDPGKVSDGSER